MAPDLFAQLPVDASRAYVNLCHRANARAAEARAECEAMWADFYDLADPNFVREFPVNFDQRWFEMYLGVVLRRAQLDVSASRGGGPDFQIEVAGRKIWIEAITPTAGNPLHADAVREPSFRDAGDEPVFEDVPVDQVTLRIAHAFRQKAGRFVQYRRDGLASPGDACVIAVNVRSIPHAWLDVRDYFFRALYGVGDPYVAIDRQTSKVVRAGRQHRPLLQRVSGAVEDVAPLLRAEHAEISAVIGSSADAANLPARAGDDFELLPHAFPNVAVPRWAIPRGREWVLRATGRNGWSPRAIDHQRFLKRGLLEFLWSRLSAHLRHRPTS